MRTEIKQKMTETADYIFRHPEISLKKKSLLRSWLVSWRRKDFI